MERAINAAVIKAESAKGLVALKAWKIVDRLQLALDWQGADPRKIPVEALRAAIHDDTDNDPRVNAYKAKIRNRATAVRAKCVECMSGDTAYVRECPSITCALWAFRMGKDPLRGYDIPKIEAEVVEDDEDNLFEDGLGGEEKDANS